MPIKAGGGAKRNASIEQGTQVSKATQRAATTTRDRHTEKLSGDTYQPVYLPWPAEREGRGGGKGRGKLPHKCTNTSSKLHDLRACTRPLMLSEDPYVGYGRMIRERR